MDDAAVMAGLVGRHLMFFLVDDDFESRVLAKKLEGYGETDDSSADDRNITIPIIAFGHLL